MEKALHKRIKLVSVLVMILFSLVAITGIIMLKSGRFESDFVIEDVIIAWVVCMVFPLISIITSYSIYNKEKIYIRKAAKYVFFIYPILLIASFIGFGSLTNIILIVIVATMFLLFTIIALLHINIFANASSLGSTIVFVVLIIISIFLKRFHIIFSGPFIVMILALFIIGSFMFGIRCLYLGERNNYFKNVSFLGSFIITLFLMGLMWKLQHWPGGDLIMYTSNILLPLATIIFLLTLPSSGFVEWKRLHKKILIRLLIPWTLIFLLFILRYLLPEVHNMIWTRDVSAKNYGFDMPDYIIELKDNHGE